MTALLLLWLAWTAFSIAFGVFIGLSIREGQRELVVLDDAEPESWQQRTWTA